MLGQKILFISFLFLKEGAKKGERCCPVCQQLQTTEDKTPNGETHRVFDHSNKMWCPYADDKAILEEYEKEQKEKTQVSWRRASEVKKLKKNLKN